MRKGRGKAGDSSPLRGIPAVERILSKPVFVPLIAEFGRGRVKEAVVTHLDGLRASAVRFDERSALDAVRSRLLRTTASSLKPVINASGVIIHTNLGRAPIDPLLWQ